MNKNKYIFMIFSIISIIFFNGICTIEIDPVIVSNGGLGTKFMSRFFAPIIINYDGENNKIYFEENNMNYYSFEAFGYGEDLASIGGILEHDNYYKPLFTNFDEQTWHYFETNSNKDYILNTSVKFSFNGFYPLMQYSGNKKLSPGKKYEIITELDMKDTYAMEVKVNSQYGLETYEVLEYYKRKISYDFIKGSSNEINNKINFVIIGEGYKETEMDEYKELVDEMINNYVFKDNNFFNKIDNNINICRIIAPSPDSGIIMADENYGEDRITFFGLDDTGRSRINFYYVISDVINIAFKDIDDQNNKLFLQKQINNDINNDTNIDVVIILANYYNSSIYNISYCLDDFIGLKNGQYCKVVVIPAKKDIGHNIETLSHELGHALAELCDEYSENNTLFENKPYNINMRNIDNKQYNSLKWHKFSGYFIDKVISEGYEGGNYQHFGLYRPTENSTMKSSLSLDFGPVNTYHLFASYLIRTNQSNGFNRNLSISYNNEIWNYEWDCLSIEKFINEGFY